MKKSFLTPALLLILALPSVATEPTERQSLIDLFEEERVAIELYQQFNAQYDLRPFANIASSEQRHREIMSDLLKSFDITPPKALGQGKFQNPELQAVFNKLSAQGKISLEKALATAALVEETDIRDLEQVAKASDSKEVKNTCEMLIAASENHLRAFIRNLESRDVTYTPQVLTQNQFKGIVSQEMSCGGNGKCNKACKQQCTGENANKVRTGKGRGKGNGARRP